MSQNPPQPTVNDEQEVARGMQLPWEIDTIHQADCLTALLQLPSGCIDLAFADPPFNIGYSYDCYEDRRAEDEYLEWCRQWLSEIYRVLKPTGTFWLAIGDEYAADLNVLARRQVGFHLRSWVVWYYTFGVNCKQKFARSHAHLLYFVKDLQSFTFHGEQQENRVPSARQLVYADRRANPRGRLPDDTWMIPPVQARGPVPATQATWVLRPQDLPGGLSQSEDTWYFPRVAGTFKERAGFHGCQMPEQLLGRIIRLCSNAGELVLDPFSGSATTLAVAKKLARHFLGFDISPQYVRRGLERLAAICVGDPLEGPPEPTCSSPPTAAGRVLNAAVVPPPTRSAAR
ncbi:MAG: hypothetical protein KatS3mg114_1286 [Planctomycetaceae bacterium]|nr:MAG: hypothetical protein KatS3mg114_1286 [Planctomycetaceae bacterium]